MSATQTSPPTTATLGWFTPTRFLLVVGIPAGLLFALIAPAWAGYDESTHFARSYDIAGGNIFPGDTAEGTGSLVPQTFRSDQERVIQGLLDGGTPFSLETLGDLFDSDPDGDRSMFFDTQPTNASMPVAYLPSAAGMALPRALDTPLVITLWAGRLANLAVYLGVVWLAVRVAASFKWTLVLASLIPLNLALGATVSPDGLTIAALMLVTAVWTRVERATLDPRTAAIAVGASGALLALSKPPYLLALALFPALWLVRRRDRAAAWAAGAGSAALGAGLILSLSASSENYRAATVSLLDTVGYQPEVQRSRLLHDPFGFLWTSTRTWVGEFDDYLQVWIRQLGFWRSDLPILAAWLVVIVILVAALRLDADDYGRLRGWARGWCALFSVAMIFVLYASSYIYFDDSTDYARIGRQMARYVLPIAAIAMMGLLPRSDRFLKPLRQRFSTDLAVGTALGAMIAVVVAPVLTWVWLGNLDDLGLG